MLEASSMMTEKKIGQTEKLNRFVKSQYIVCSLLIE